MADTVRLDFVPHLPAWGVRAQRDMARIRQALGVACHAVHHVGSTAVPGLAAVPIVDLVAALHSLAALEAARLRLMVHGFRPALVPASGPASGTARPTYHATDIVSRQVQVELTCFAAGDREMARLVALFAYLRAHPPVAQAYEAAKRAARTRHSDPHAYDAAKHAWLGQHLDAALAFDRTAA